MGSMLIGSKAFIKKCRRIRKVFGGGMRQAGYMAATGIYALTHHAQRLQQAHHHAQLLATALEGKHYVKQIQPVETNILIFDVPLGTNAKELVAKFKEQDVWVMDISPMQIRMVLHLDISEAMVQRVIEVIEKI